MKWGVLAFKYSLPSALRFRYHTPPLSFLLSLGCCSSAGFGLHWRVLDITVLEGFKGAEMKASAFEDG